MRSILLALAILLPTASAVQADVLALSAPNYESGVSKPAKGSTMTAVLRDFGTPTTKRAPVGGGSRHQPPITRWDYPGFSVFFENNHVVDAVVPSQPPALQRTDELQASP